MMLKVAISGMTCQGCARRVAAALEEVDGVASAVVELQPGRATVRWKPDRVARPAAIFEAVQKAGHEARPAEAVEPAAHGDGGGSRWGWVFEGWTFNLGFGGVVMVGLMVGEWGLSLGMNPVFQWVAFALALPAQALCGARFYRGAWQQLRVGRSNMDTLVALGSTTAFGYSVWGLLAGWGTHVYFMESVAILTLISLGHWLEAKASARAASSLRALLDLAPATARWLSAAGIETEVPVARLQVGDRVVLRPGDRVPTDGEVIEGQSAVDEAMLTGESLAVEKGPGMTLYAGTVNRDGRLIMGVTATGEGTALAHIIGVVQRAQSSRAQIQRLGDAVSSVFVPVVVLLALAAGCWWGLDFAGARAVHEGLLPYLWHVILPAGPLAAACLHAAAVLIVACPCAMGLATPAAIMAGANVAARRGILIRDGAALEKSGRINAILFDKTGTLTEGNVSVAAVEDLRPAPVRGATIESLAAAVAAPSSHPLSQAVAQLGREPAPDPTREPPASGAEVLLTEWRELRGRGVQARAEGGTLRLGSLAWLLEGGVRPERAAAFVAEWSRQGATVLGLALEHHLLGVLALRDTLKPHAAEVVRRLAASGQVVYLVTGDHASTAAAVAQQAGIPALNVFAEVQPEKKAGLVQRLQQRGQRVAFVGDGINDAPALEQADLGIAVSRASDVAREAADIILLRSDIEAIPEALALAQATLRTIRQNLFWAFCYNAAAVPLAALGFLSPVLCAAAMGLSDLLVIGNALRLRRWRPRPLRRGGDPRRRAASRV
ncbi:MAG: cation-translocating P-type ATPase [Verrucomicrobia bacterium]|nr:cation-translocating P-type ATPase [Verrucomicrobiota bacterium]